MGTSWLSTSLAWISSTFVWVTPTLIVALLALYIARANYRRNNFPVIRLVECECSYPSLGVCQFWVLIQNLGIPLHNIHLALSFNDASGFGRARMPLNARVRFPAEKPPSPVCEGQYAKGMYAEFSFQTDELSKGDQTFLSLLKDPRKQGACLTLYSDGYRAWQCRLDRRSIRFRRLWNRLALKIDCLFTREVKIEG